MHGIISTIAGTREPGYTGDGGSATAAQLREPLMCEFDSMGNLFIAEATNRCLRRLDSNTGVLTTIAGLGKVGDGGPELPD